MKIFYIQLYNSDRFSIFVVIYFTNYIYYKSFAYNIPNEGVVASLIAIISSVASHSCVEVNSSYREPIGGLYIVYSGQFGTNKSMVIKTAKNEYKKMEIFCHDKNNESAKSAINASATVELLLEELEKNNNLIQFYDEFDTLIQSFGLYKMGTIMKISMFNSFI